MRDCDKNENNLAKTELETAKENQEKQEKYLFVKEVIKEKPAQIHRIFWRSAGLLAGAVVFGLVSALVFVHFFPVFQEQMKGEDKIVFEEDDPNVTGVPAQADAQGNEDLQGDAEDLDSTDGLNSADSDRLKDTENSGNAVSGEPLLDTYQKIYHEMNIIAKDAMKSVVTVTGISNNEDWFNVSTKSIKQVSGVVIADNNQEFYILTEYRAVDDVDRIMVTFSDGSMADGRYQMHDSNTGLTVLKVAKSDLPNGNAANVKVALLGNSYMTQQGESVIAIGSPMGYSNSIVYGQVTSTTNTASAYDIQYNLFITNILGSKDGSGVLINLSGEVIGMIAQDFSDETHQNVITGLPISQLKSMLNVLSNGGDLPYIGIKGQNVTAEITKQTGMPKGIYVSEAKADSPALQAGIQKADIITKYNGKTIETMYQYSESLSKANPGDVVDITVMRKGAEGYVEFEFQVTIGSG